MAPDQPVFLIVAGPNGSGKSSAYRNAALQFESRNFWIINPDLLAARISASESLPYQTANLEAVKRIEVWLDASINAHQTIGVETVLSTDKYRRLAVEAHNRGFKIWLIYVVLDSPGRNIERVRSRVAKGGHDVPSKKIIERYHRSLLQMPWFLDQADRAWIYDNSGDVPRLMAEKCDGHIRRLGEILPVIESALN